MSKDLSSSSSSQSEVDDKLVWMEEFSSRLKSLLETSGLTVNHAAKEISIDAKNLRLYINKETVPTAPRLIKIAQYFNVSADYLLLGSTGYSDEFKTVISGSASLIKNFKSSLGVSKSEDGSKLTLTIDDSILTILIYELWLMRDSVDFDADLVAQVCDKYGKLRVFDGHLVSEEIFYNLISKEFIYQDSDSDNGFSQLDIKKRTEQWNAMCKSDRDAWWNFYSHRNLKGSE